MIDVMKCVFSLLLILLFVVSACSDEVSEDESDVQGIPPKFLEGGGSEGGGGNEGNSPFPLVDVISSDTISNPFDVSDPPLPEGGGSDCSEDFAFCQDGNPCTTEDYCEGGECVPGVFLCDDGFQCTEDFCDANAICSHEIALGWCFIEGACYLNSETLPGDPCSVCTPQSSTGEWTVSGAADENSGPTCTNAGDLGDLSDGGATVNVVGSIADDHDSDWYVFEGNDDEDVGGCDSYHVRARLLQNPSQAYAIDVRKGACPVENQVCEGAQDFEWYTNFMDGELGECHCTNVPEETSDTVHLCTDNSVRYYVRVYLKTGQTAGCQPYLLEVTNGVY